VHENKGEEESGEWRVAGVEIRKERIFTTEDTESAEVTRRTGLLGGILKIGGGRRWVMAGSVVSLAHGARVESRNHD
jgi:hypothetical protein